MTKNDLLDCLKSEIADTVKEFILPVRMKKGESTQSYRAANIYKMRVPDSGLTQQLAPYIILQAISGADVQKAGDKRRASATVRLIFCVYNPDEQEGALALLELMERVRIRLLQITSVGKRYTLDISDNGLESIIYPDDTAPYYAGEMLTVWNMPIIEKEVSVF